MAKKKIPELLAPAGSIESLCAAVSAGADAVYLGGKKFGARKFASNFTADELKRAIEYCHSRNVRVYVTHNILVHDSEISDSVNELHFLFNTGVDAVLLQDYGILGLASELLPGLELHASTQMTIHNTEGVEWAVEKGLSRVVLSREMNLKDISEIKNSPSTEDSGLEVFIHGALCCSYSGQCLLSSIIGGRSGNRGVCAQPCRKEYEILSLEYDEYENICGKEGQGSCYIMSPADLCTYRNLESIVALGVDSLKIEGRMKSPEYVATVVSIYRKALDMIAAGKAVPSEKEETLLMLAFNRGFTGGYISGDFGREIMSVDRPGNRGVYAGKVSSYDPSKREVAVIADAPIMLQAGDGILIINDKFDEGFGLEIPGNAERRGNKIFFNTKNPAVPGSRVYITKSILLSKRAKEISSFPGGVFKKIPVSLRICFDGKVPVANAYFPTLSGHLSLEFRANFSMEEAKSRPLAPADLKKIFCKTGNLQFDIVNYRSDYDGGFFAPVSLLNEFRRNLFLKIENRMIEAVRPSDEEIKEVAERIERYNSSFNEQNFEKIYPTGVPSISVCVSTPEAAKAAMRGGCSRIYYEMDTNPEGDTGSYALDLIDTISTARKYNSDLIWKWPRITDSSFFRTVEEVLRTIGDVRPDGIMVENPGDGIAAMRIAEGIPLYGGQGLNIFNHLSVGMFSADYSLLTLSCELNRSELEILCGMAGSYSNRPLLEYMVHGNVEVFVSENNLPDSSLGEKYSSGINYGIRDYTGRIFSVHVDGYGRTHIYNSAVTCLIDNMPEVISTGIDTISLNLIQYPPGMVEKTVALYKEAVAASCIPGKEKYNVLRMLKSKISKLYSKEFTKGHFYRGV